MNEEENRIVLIKTICKKYIDTQNINILKDDILENNIDLLLIVFHCKFVYNIDINLLFNSINKRIGQQLFRKKLMDRFNNKCVIDPENYNLPTDCEACHIIPVCIYSDYNINNGLFMNKHIHQYFDKYEFTINPDSLKIELKGKASKQNLIKQLEGKVIEILKKYEDIKYYLKMHYSEFKKNELNII